MSASGSDRLFKILLAVIGALVGAVGWLLQQHLNELDGRIDFVRDQLFRSCHIISP